MRLKVKKWISILMVFVYFSGCNREAELPYSMESSILGGKFQAEGSVLEIGYDKYTWQRYAYDFEELTELDHAHLNPSEEKQRVEMVLLSDGTVNMTIEKMDFERKIIIPHQTLPNEIPVLRKR